MNCEYSRGVLRPQDIFITCKIHCLAGQSWSFARLAGSLSISVGETHNAVARAKEAKVLTMAHGQLEVSRRRLLDLLTLGVPQIYYATKGPLCLGVPTSVYAPCHEKRFSVGSVPLVWPHATGSVRGESLLPLYPTVPRAVQHDPKLYEMMSLVDVVRTTEPKERKLAVEFLGKMIWENEGEKHGN